MEIIKKIILFGLLLLLVSCFPVETKNAEKAYKYWSKGEPPKEIKLINGEYYQSPHFSLEYELFLKFKSDKKWFNEFIEYNKLEIDTMRNDWARWTELPKWFKTDSNYLIYAKNQTDEFERSRYFINPKTGICYIYESTGM
ncbi:hypothetical protein [Aquimarina sediminis]|uniref:hypothetical protein n=1 Tax=Aquimarina sediminis TaxID=2070536 RepID=UPI000CA0846A|nr:hypothetical protein [Aquimarina sediminis]